MALNKIVEQQTVEVQISDFGRVTLTLKEYLDSNAITRNQLSVATGIKCQTV